MLEGLGRLGRTCPYTVVSAVIETVGTQLYQIVLNVVIVMLLKEKVRVEIVLRGPLYIYIKYKIYINIGILFYNI